MRKETRIEDQAERTADANGEHIRKKSATECVAIAEAKKVWHRSSKAGSGARQRVN